MRVANNQGTNADAAGLGRIIASLVGSNTRWGESICTIHGTMFYAHAGSIVRRYITNANMPSARGIKWAQVDFQHGDQNLHDAKLNPGGYIFPSRAEMYVNPPTLTAQELTRRKEFSHQDLSEFINSHVRSQLN